MAKTDPIRCADDIQRFKKYFLDKDQIRNYVLVTLAVNTSLRISDILNLQWGKVYSFKHGTFKKHLEIIEHKTGKKTKIAINCEVVKALNILQLKTSNISDDDFIFLSRVGENRPISRSYAYKIIKNAALELEIEGNISCHSMRKTFGYHAWKEGTPPALLMAIYNHSSIEITKRYLSIDQDDKDAVFLEMIL